MKKLTMLLAAIGVAASTVSFAQENVEYIPYSYPWANLNNGGVVPPGPLDELCRVLARQIDNSHSRLVDARFNSFTRSYDGDKERPFICDIKRQALQRVDGEVIWYPPDGGDWSTASWYGPAICTVGGLYSELPEPYDINVCHVKRVINK